MKDCYFTLLEKGFSHSAKLGWLIRWSDLVAIGVIPFIFAWLGFVRPDGELPFIWLFAIFSFGVIQAGLLLIRLFKPETPQDMFYLGDKLYRDNCKKDSDIKDLERDVQYLTKYKSISDAFHALTHPKSLEGKSQKERFETIEIMLQMVVQYRDYFFDCSKDIWTFKVYLFDKDDRLLKCICGFRSDRHPEGSYVGKDGRYWQSGEGHIGRAFMDLRAIITGDANDLEVWNLMGAPKNNKPYDREVYKSFASVPIMNKANTPLIKDTDPLEAVGVLIATSDQIDRFNMANSAVLDMLADMIGIALYQQQGRAKS